VARIDAMGMPTSQNGFDKLACNELLEFPGTGAGEKALTSVELFPGVGGLAL